jgi:hypothetical protein
VEWIVASCQPFTEVDNPQFRALMKFVKPVLGEKMVHSTQLKEKIDTEFAKARERFKEIIEVYNQNCFA